MADDIQIKGLDSNLNPTQAQGNQASQTGQATQVANQSQAGSQPQATATTQTQATTTTQTATQSQAVTTATPQSQATTTTQVASTQRQETQVTTQDQGIISSPNQGQAIPTAQDQTQIQTVTSSQAPAKPSNRRAFNLAEELEEDTTPAPPEKYAIPSLVKEKFPDLVDLIKTTESMSDDEREYWFQILPIMTEDQIKKFRDILLNEKEQLAKLDNEYEEELNRLNEKHMLEWKEFETKEKRRVLTEAEQKAESAEQQTEEELLAKLSQI